MRKLTQKLIWPNFGLRKYEVFRGQLVTFSSRALASFKIILMENYLKK